ncbi:response regulator [Notoacmeibacter sp. MSK16QG-6]|uniref:response regulator n=1 Tax=Notoacmeibacter sp. MSK16QG-6 TaxID=2957982 RepID=UPI00209CF3F4|nr:response regulator [Notoacmeibacter sp. MSK16QG-6]MCP1199354.1 response regulator [Notoacmeibacter sp. MSK16QG-6]
MTSTIELPGLFHTHFSPLLSLSQSRDFGGKEKLSGRSILLVEDELMLALDIELELEDAGASVIGPVDRLDLGMALLDDAPMIDAAILDIDLHGVESFPIASRLRERGVPFLFHTGHGTRSELKEQFGDVTVCKKPVLSEQLIDAVAKLL